MTAKQFKMIRKKLGLTQKQMGELLGYSLRHIQRFEAGTIELRKGAAEYLINYLENNGDVDRV